MDKTCYFTQEKCLPATNYFDLDGRSYVSPTCGRYRFAYNDAEKSFDKMKTASFLCFNALKETKKYYLLTSTEYSVMFEDKDIDAIILTPEIVENWYPKTFAQRIDLLLCHFMNRLMI